MWEGGRDGGGWGGGEDGGKGRVYGLHQFQKFRWGRHVAIIEALLPMVEEMKNLKEEMGNLKKDYMSFKQSGTHSPLKDDKIVSNAFNSDERYEVFKALKEAKRRK